MELRKLSSNRHSAKSNYIAEWTISKRAQTPVVGTLDTVLKHLVDHGADDVEALTVGDVVEIIKG